MSPIHATSSIQVPARPWDCALTERLDGQWLEQKLHGEVHYDLKPEALRALGDVFRQTMPHAAPLGFLQNILFHSSHLRLCDFGSASDRQPPPWHRDAFLEERIYTFPNISKVARIQQGNASPCRAGGEVQSNHRQNSARHITTCLKLGVRHRWTCSSHSGRRPCFGHQSWQQVA